MYHPWYESIHVFAQWEYYNGNLHNILERYVSYSKWYILCSHSNNVSTVWYSCHKGNVWHFYRPPWYSPISKSSRRGMATGSYCQYVISNNALLHGQPFANNWSSVTGSVTNGSWEMEPWQSINILRKVTSTKVRLITNKLRDNLKEMLLLYGIIWRRVGMYL